MDALKMGLEASANVAKEVAKACKNGLLGGKRFNFKSQICTDRIQSERLLALGIKRETADCHWYYSDEKWKMGEECNSIACKNLYPKYYIPAWSLHRLIEMYAERYISCSINLKDLTYEWLINEIEIHIKEGDFNKEYLENGN